MDENLVGYLLKALDADEQRDVEDHLRQNPQTQKRLEILREIVPKLRRVVAFYNPQNPAAIESINEAREAARNLGLELVERHVASIVQLQAAVEAFKGDEAVAVVAISDAMVDS